MLSRLPDADSLFAPLLDQDGPFGVAVSGGPDSLALMVLAAEWSRRHEKRLVVYTLDHQLRPEAGAECAMVIREAERLGLSARRLTWAGDKPASGVQAAARSARYRLIGAAMHADGAMVLMTAHHADDQAETVLMRLAHGSGIGGAGGMAPMTGVEGVKVFRPLLGMSRADLTSIVHGAGLLPAQDPSNTDRHYERVRWRGMLPGLAAEGLTVERLNIFAMRARRAEEALEKTAREMFARHVAIDAFGVAHVAVDFFAAANDEISLRVLAKALAWTGGDGRPAGLRQVERLHELVCGSGQCKQTLGGAVIHKTERTVMIYREARRIPQIGLSLSPGETTIWDSRFEICVTPKRKDLVVSPGTRLTRKNFEDVTGRAVTVPIAALRSLPVVHDPEGGIKAIGPAFQSAEVAVAYELEPLEKTY